MNEENLKEVFEHESKSQMPKKDNEIKMGIMG
jgi:hypothetical protein